MLECWLINADDVVLLAASANAMCKMLRLCDDFASDFDVKFNANNSKCIVLKPCCSHLPAMNLGFHIGGNEIEIVDEWPHLGHIITNRCDDDADIMNRRNCMVAEMNNVLRYFGKLSALTKLKLMNLIVWS